MRSALLLFTLLASAAPALADPPADAAEVAYQEGRRLYDLQEWDAAIAKFKEAYQVRSDAASLFNIAQSYRLKGDCANASSFYKTYKRNFPTAPNIAKVDKFLTDLETCTATEPVKPVTEPVKPVIEPVKAVTEPIKPVITPPLAVHHTDGDAGHGERLAGIGVGIGGVVLLGVGALFAHSASNKAKTVTDTMNQPWDPSLENDGKSASTRAAIFLSIGGAALVTGGVLYFLGHRRSSESGLSLLPRRDGGMMVWACDL